MAQGLGGSVSIMATVSLAETQALAELADVFCSFLPGSGAIFTWKEAAERHDVGQFWIGGSKLPAITQLLEATYQYRRDCFCDLMITAVKEGMKYRIKNRNAVTREAVDKINTLLLRLRFKIPELNDRAFLGLLPRGKPETASTPTAGPSIQVVPREAMQELHRQFLELLAESNTQARGYKFEHFLNELFFVHGLAPRGSFRLVGEQIDGSFELLGSTYLVEARWRKEAANSTDLLALRGKAEKSEWTRGLFISANGYSDLTSETHRIGRKVNLIAMSGHDIILILEEHWSLLEALRVKLRHAGETGDVYLSLAQAQR